MGMRSQRRLLCTGTAGAHIALTLLWAFRFPLLLHLSSLLLLFLLNNLCGSIMRSQLAVTYDWNWRDTWQCSLQGGAHGRASFSLSNASFLTGCMKTESVCRVDGCSDTFSKARASRLQCLRERRKGGGGSKKRYPKREMSWFSYSGLVPPLVSIAGILKKGKMEGCLCQTTTKVSFALLSKGLN